MTISSKVNSGSSCKQIGRLDDDDPIIVAGKVVVKKGKLQERIKAGRPIIHKK